MKVLDLKLSGSLRKIGLMVKKLSSLFKMEQMYGLFLTEINLLLMQAVRIFL